MSDTPTQTTKALYDSPAIIEALRLIIADGQVTELRALEATTDKDRWPHTASGYFDDADKLAAALATIRTAKGIYIVPNPVDRALLARAANRIRKTSKGESTQDTNIVRRRWLLIDTDPQRPSGISATEAEHEAALEHARVIYAYLKGCGWPEPIAADSGNGAHLLYRIDVPPDDAGLVESCLKALAARFDDDAVKVDQTVFNPARIWKLYGTLACKGDDTPDRPHRLARILNAPAELQAVDGELLQALADEARAAAQVLDRQPYNGDGQPFDVQAFIERNRLDVDGPEDWRGQQGPGKRWLLNQSPQCGHGGDGPFIIQHASGAITAGCHHDSCTWDWKALRAQFELPQAKPNTASKTLTACDDSPIETDDPWPEPLDEAAHHGLVGDITAAIEPHSEADPAAILMQTLIAFGNVIGRTAYFRAEADRHFGNLFAVLVGDTSKGRKGTSWGQASRLFEPIDPEWREKRILGGLSSGEGLIWAVRDPVSKRQPVYEGKGKDKRIKTYEDVVVDKGVADKRLTVMEGEFSAVLKVASRQANTISAIMRQAWDTGNLRILTKNSPAQSTNAHISIIGHITRNELRRLITDTDLANGFANRFLWYCVRRSKCLPEGGTLRESDRIPLVERLYAAVKFAAGIGEIRRDEAARAVWREVYPSLSEGKPGLLGTATSRAEAQVMRLAMLYALLDSSPKIRSEHLLAGLAVWTYAEQSARYVFGSALGDPMADVILGELRRRPDGMSRNEIREHFGRNKRSDEIARALGVLFEHHLIRRETQETSGRPKELFFARV